MIMFLCLVVDIFVLWLRVFWKLVEIRGKFWISNDVSSHGTSRSLLERFSMELVRTLRFLVSQMDGSSCVFKESRLASSLVLYPTIQLYSYLLTSVFRSKFVLGNFC